MNNSNSFPTFIEINQPSTELAMSLSSFSHLLTGMATVADIKKQVATFMTVAKIARPVTVKIHSSSGGTGSGVIINRQEDTYTVLTANHVVESTGVKYSIHTNKGNNYAVTKVRKLQQHKSKTNLALVQFVSPYTHLTATLGSSDDALIGTDIYVSGYSKTICTEKQEFEKGVIIGRPNEKLLYYNAPTWRGMGGAPVFNASAQVVGIHIAGEVDLDSSIGCNMGFWTADKRLAQAVQATLPWLHLVDL